MAKKKEELPKEEQRRILDSAVATYLTSGKVITRREKDGTMTYHKLVNGNMIRVEPPQPIGE